MFSIDLPRILLNTDFFSLQVILNIYYFQSVKYVELVLFSIFKICWPCTIFSLWTPQTRQVSNRDDTEKLKEHEQKQEKVEKLARSTLALKHNEAQRSSLYHIDNNHLTSAKSPRAPARSGAQCTQYIFILQVLISAYFLHQSRNQPFLFEGEKWPSKKTSDPRIGSGSNALAPAAKNWGRSQGGGSGGRFLRPSQVWWEQAKAKFGQSSSNSQVQVFGYPWCEESKSRPSVSGERFEETKCQGSTLAEVSKQNNPITTVSYVLWPSHISHDSWCGIFVGCLSACN